MSSYSMLSYSNDHVALLTAKEQCCWIEAAGDVGTLCQGSFGEETCASDKYPSSVFLTWLISKVSSDTAFLWRTWPRNMLQTQRKAFTEMQPFFR